MSRAPTVCQALALTWEYSSQHRHRQPLGAEGHHPPDPSHPVQVPDSHTCPHIPTPMLDSTHQPSYSFATCLPPTPALMPFPHTCPFYVLFRLLSTICPFPIVLSPAPICPYMSQIFCLFSYIIHIKNPVSTAPSPPYLLLSSHTTYRLSVTLSGLLHQYPLPAP